MKSHNPNSDILRAQPSADPYDVWKQNPTPSNMTKLLKHLEPTIRSAMTTHAGGNKSQVLKGKARVLAMRAVQKYDPNRGIALNSHILTQLQPLSRYSMQAIQPMKMSERRMRQIKSLSDAEKSYYDTYGREPSEIELADELGISTKKINKIRESGVPSISTAATYGGTDPITSRTNQVEVITDYVYHDLGEIDRKIMDYKLGRAGYKPHGNLEIASKLKISPSAVTQRLARIQAKLNSAIGETS